MLLVNVPSVGLGTFQLNEAMGNGQFEMLVGAFVNAIEVGYRHFDTAAMYLTEKHLGEAIKRCTSKGIVKREELLIATKIPMTFMHPNIINESVESSLGELGLEYIDIMYFHWPIVFEQQRDDPSVLFPKDEAGNYLFDESVELRDSYKALSCFQTSRHSFGIRDIALLSALMKCVSRGHVRHIGLSNFSIPQITDILNDAELLPKPLVHQFECHIYFQQPEMVEFCLAHNIIPVAYSPLAKGDNAWEGRGERDHFVNPLCPKVDILNDERLVELSNKYGHSVAQIALQFLVQRGLRVIPKSSNRNRQAENLRLDFALSDDDMRALAGLDLNARGIDFNHCKSYKYYPF